MQPQIYLREFIFKIFLNEAINIFGFPVGSEVDNLSANARDADSIPDQEDPLEKEMATRASILAR